MNEVIEAAPPGALQATTPADLLRLAVSGGADLDRLERLMKMQQEWEAAQAKKAYNEAFAAFKSEAVRIVKNQTVKQGPLQGTKFAELHAVVNAVTPALSKHGLSASWQIVQDEKDWIVIRCELRHVLGHSESVQMGGPPDTTGGKNAIQARRSTGSYLERYTLLAILGLAEQSADDDGQGGARADAAAAEPADAALQAVIDNGDASAALGGAAFAEWWASLTAKGRHAVKDRAAGWRQTAQEFDLAHAEPASRDPFVAEFEAAERRNVSDAAPNARGARGAKR